MKDQEDRRAARRAGSRERDQHHKSSGGGTHLNVPVGVELFQPQAKSYKLDFSLYEVGKHNPYCKDTGALYYELTYWRHRNIGPNNDVYCCPNKMRKERCAVCEYRAGIEKQGCPDGMDRKVWWRKEVSPFNPQEMQLWLPHIRGGDDEKVLLWDISHFCFGKLLDQLRKAAEEDDTYKTDFDDPKAGSYLNVTFADEKAEDFSFLKALSIEFVPRPKGMNPALLNHNINLELIPVIPTYEELRKAFLQIESDGDDDRVPRDEPSDGKKGRNKPKSNEWEDEAPPSKTEKAVEKEEKQPEPEKEPTAQDLGLEEGMKVQHRKFGICEIRRISGDGTSLTLLDAEDEVHKACSPADVRKARESDASPKKESAGSAPEKERSSATTEAGSAKTAQTSRSDDWDEKPAKTEKKEEKKSTGDGWDDELTKPAKTEKKSKPAADDWD